MICAWDSDTGHVRGTRTLTAIGGKCLTLKSTRKANNRDEDDAMIEAEGLRQSFAIMIISLGQNLC